jgi:hypothetical protein
MKDTTEKIVNEALWTNEGPGSNPDKVSVILSKTLSFHMNIYYTPQYLIHKTPPFKSSYTHNSRPGHFTITLHTS